MYDFHLKNGTKAVEPLIEDAMSTLGQQQDQLPSLTLDAATMQQLLDGSALSVAVVAFNPTSWQVTKFIEVPCFQTNLNVVDANGNAVAYDILPTLNLATGPCLVPETCGYANVTSPYMLFVEAILPALGYATYFVSVNTSAAIDGAVFTRSSETHQISNGVIKLEFDEISNLLSHITNLALRKSASVSQNFMQYEDLKSSTGGAYYLNPTGPATSLVDRPLAYEVVQGRFVTEVRQTFTVSCHDAALLNITCGVTQVHRLFTSSDSTLQNVVDIVTSVGPLNIYKDFVSRYTTSLETDGVFFTDDNCFDTHQRQYNSSSMLTIYRVVFHLHTFHS